MPDDRKTELERLQKFASPLIANTLKKIDGNTDGIDTKKHAEGFFSIIERELTRFPIWVGTESDIDQTTYLIELLELIKDHYQQNCQNQSKNSQHTLTQKQFDKPMFFYNLTVLANTKLLLLLEALGKETNKNKEKELVLVCQTASDSYNQQIEQHFAIIEFYIKIKNITFAKAAFDELKEIINLEKNKKPSLVLNSAMIEKLTSKASVIESEIILLEAEITRAGVLPQISQSLLPADYQSDIASNTVDLIRKTGADCDKLYAQLSSISTYRDYLFIYREHDRLTRDFLRGDNPIFKITGVTPRALEFLEFKYRQTRFSLVVLIAAKAIYAKDTNGEANNDDDSDEHQKENIALLHLHILKAATNILTTLEQILYTHYCLGDIERAHEIHARLKEIMAIIRNENINLSNLRARLAFDSYSKRIIVLNTSCLNEKAAWDCELLKKHREKIKKFRGDFTKANSKNNFKEIIKLLEQLIQIIKETISKTFSLPKEHNLKVFFSTAHTLVDMFSGIYQKTASSRNNKDFIKNMSHLYSQFICLIHQCNPAYIPTNVVDEISLRSEAITATATTKKTTVEEVFAAWLANKENESSEDGYSDSDDYSSSDEHSYSSEYSYSSDCNSDEYCDARSSDSGDAAKESNSQLTIENNQQNSELQGNAAVVKEEKTQSLTKNELTELVKKYCDEALTFAKEKRFRDKGTVREFIDIKAELKDLDFQTRCKLIDRLFNIYILPYNQGLFKSSSKSPPAIPAANGIKTSEATNFTYS